MRRIAVALSLMFFLCGAFSVAHAGKFGTAKIVGKVIFKGEKPAEKPIKMDADPKCAEQYPEMPTTKHFVLNEDGTLQNVFVYVKEGITGKYDPPKDAKVVLDQHGCWYSPMVFGVQVGQKFIIRNDDDTLHNVHAMPKKNREFNVGMPMKGMQIKKKFKKPEVMVKFKCDVHPWMFAYVGVLPHPFFDTTDENGFEIDRLPAGEYVLEAWHKKLGTVTKKVTVKEGETKEVDFVMEYKGK